MSDRLTLNVPGKAEYVGTVRMAVGHVASRAGFDIEAIEDIKIAVSEACTNIILHAQGDMVFNYDILIELDESAFAITVEDTGTGFGLETYEPPDPGEPRSSGLGIFNIRALMDEVDIHSEPGSGTKIRMAKALQNLDG